MIYLSITYFYVHANSTYHHSQDHPLKYNYYNFDSDSKRLICYFSLKMGSEFG